MLILLYMHGQPGASYPHQFRQTESVVFPHPAAAIAITTTIHVGSNSVADKPQFYVGSMVQADVGQEKELQRRLCSARQVFRSLLGYSALLQDSRPGFQALKLYESLVVPRLMYSAVESWALTEAQGAHLVTFYNASLRQMLGLHRGPGGHSTAELLATTGQATRPQHG